MIKLAIVLALIFSPLAALSSYLITYIEYKRHFPENPGRARKLSLTFALTTLIFFVVMILLTVTFVNKFLPK